MKLFSLRSFLILAVVLAIVANILWRLPESSPKAANTAMDKEGVWGEKNILPTTSNLVAMGKQWKERLATLPPEERKKSEARLQEETRFFVEAHFLPPEERKVKVRERIESLMNDPGIQADWAAERIKMFTRLPAEKRQEIMKKYVQSKNQKTQTP